jgi:hypothetical protein
MNKGILAKQNYMKEREMAFPNWMSLRPGLLCLILNLPMIIQCFYRLCGVVVRVPGYRPRGPGSISGATRFFWEVMGLQRGPLSLVSTIEELLGRKSSSSGLESREYGRGDPLCWPCKTLYPQKLALTSRTSDGRSVDIVRSRTQVMELSFLIYIY